MRLVVKNAKDQQIPAKLSGNKVTINNITYEHKNLDCLPKGLRLEDIKVKEVAGGIAFASKHAWPSNFYPVNFQLLGKKFNCEIRQVAAAYFTCIRLRSHALKPFGYFKVRKSSSHHVKRSIKVQRISGTLRFLHITESTNFFFTFNHNGDPDPTDVSAPTFTPLDRYFQLILVNHICVTKTVADFKLSVRSGSFGTTCHLKIRRMVRTSPEANLKQAVRGRGLQIQARTSLTLNLQTLTHPPTLASEKFRDGITTRTAPRDPPLW